MTKVLSQSRLVPRSVRNPASGYSFNQFETFENFVIKKVARPLLRLDLVGDQIFKLDDRNFFISCNFLVDKMSQISYFDTESEKIARFGIASW